MPCKRLSQATPPATFSGLWDASAVEEKVGVARAMRDQRLAIMQLAVVRPRSSRP